MKTFNDFFFDRFCSASLDQDMEDKLDTVCREVFYIDFYVISRCFFKRIFLIGGS